MGLVKDVLKKIPYRELPKLRDFYKDHQPYATHVHSFLNTTIKWNKLKPNNNYITIFAPHGDWRRDGTIIAIMQFKCYDLFVFTLDRRCELLYASLKETKQIDWNQKRIMYDTLHQNHRNTILNIIKEKKLPMIFDLETKFWWMGKERAATLDIQCPDEYYIKTLEPKHAPIINEAWPHKYEESVGYISTLLEINGGHGVFRKSDDTLMSWIVKNQYGGFGNLQTLNEAKREGFASLVTKSLCKEIALEGHNPFVTVLLGNIGSRTTLRKLGFQALDSCFFIATGNRRVANNMK